MTPAESNVLLREFQENSFGLVKTMKENPDLDIVGAWVYLHRGNLPTNDFIKLKKLAEDLKSSATFAAALAGDRGLVKGWDKLNEYLPVNLRHFSTNIQHAQFAKHADTQNVLLWIKNNKPNLFSTYSNLTPGEIIALNYYTTSNGNQINYWLRANKNNAAVLPVANWSTEHGENYLKFLETAFEKLPHYSGTPLLRAEIRTQAQMSMWAAGTELPYPGFISTAKNASSDYFDAGGFSHNIIFNIHNSGSAKAIDIEPFSQHPTELEVLFFRGKKIKLNSSPELKRYPDENKVDEWETNSFPSAELDANGNPILINPNFGTPNADKILIVSINIID